MEQPNSNHISHVKLESKKPKKNLVKFFGYALLAVVLGVLIQIKFVQECNHQPKIQKLEPTPGEELTTWLKNYLDDNLILALTYFLYFLWFSLYYFNCDLTYKKSPIYILIYPIFLGVMFFMTMFTRDYIVQDPSDFCKIKLTKCLHITLLYGGAYFTIFAFIALQHLLTTFCQKKALN